MNSKSTDISENWPTLSDTHCTLTVPHCSFHWLPRYPTVPYGTFLLNITVSHRTALYSPSDFQCTPPPRKPLYRALISTVTHCTVCHSTINLKSKIVLNIFSMIIFSIFIFNYDVYSIYIVKNSTSRQN